MNIGLFHKEVNVLLEKNKFIELNITFGYINKDAIMNYNINTNTLNRYKKFIETRYKKKIIKLKNIIIIIWY